MPRQHYVAGAWVLLPWHGSTTCAGSTSVVQAQGVAQACYTGDINFPTTTGPVQGNESGECSVTWLRGQVMQMMREIDGKNSLHFHLEQKLLEAIAEGKYVDFAKLLQEEIEDGEGLQVVKQNGLEFFIPATKPPSKISDHGTWEKVFVVFQSAYQVYFPKRAGQLLEYKELIDRLAQVFDWGKVYSYDKHFRHVMADNPQRPWGLVNQDAKDKYLLKAGGAEKGKKVSAPGAAGDKSEKVKKWKELCRR